MKFLRLAPFMALAVFLSACASDDRSVVPIALSQKIEALYVVSNPSLAEENENLLSEIVSQLVAKGFAPMIVTADTVPEGACYITYSARMSGSTVKTLSFLRIEVRKGKQTLGFGFSDASGSLDRYTDTSARVHSLMDGIFRYVEPMGNARR